MPRTFLEKCLADLDEMPTHRGKVRARWELVSALETLHGLMAELRSCEDSRLTRDVLTDWIEKGVAAEEAIESVVDEMKGRDRSISHDLVNTALATTKDDINSMHEGLVLDREGLAEEAD